jgi:hypothetical protein
MVIHRFKLPLLRPGTFDLDGDHNLQIHIGAGSDWSLEPQITILGHKKEYGGVYSFICS